MPILTSFAEPDWIDPDTVDRPVVTFGVATAQVGRFELDPHRHTKGQVLLVQRGAISCEVEGGMWIVPPSSALWIPGGALHAIEVAGHIEGYGAFIRPNAATGFPLTCCTLAVTPLLRELIIRSAILSAHYTEGGMESRLVQLLLDEIASASIEDLHLPMPSDRRLCQLVEMIMATPADQSTMDIWAQRVGLSERTLARLISHETGMSFSRWRHQLDVLLAVKWLAGGAAIKACAADLGYESVPSFVTMFRKTLGTSPGRFMAERKSRNSLLVENESLQATA